MGSPLPWLWLLGAGVALIVGVIAFVVASGLTESPTYGAAASHDRRHPARGSGRIRRAS